MRPKFKRDKNNSFTRYALRKLSEPTKGHNKWKEEQKENKLLVKRLSFVHDSIDERFNKRFLRRVSGGLTLPIFEQSV